MTLHTKQATYESTISIELLLEVEQLVLKPKTLLLPLNKNNTFILLFKHNQYQ